MRQHGIDAERRGTFHDARVWMQRRIPQAHQQPPAPNDAGTWQRESMTETRQRGTLRRTQIRRRETEAEIEEEYTITRGPCTVRGCRCCQREYHLR